MHLHTIFSEAARDLPDKRAIQCLGEALTYRELEALTERLAQHWLAKGFRTGERVALWLPNCPEALIAYLSCFRGGLIAVALDFRYQPAEALYCLQRSAAAGLITLADKWESLKAIQQEQTSLREVIVAGMGARFEDQLLEASPIPAVRSEEGDYLSTIFFTSGTTSRPKGVTHTSRRTVSRIEKFVEETRLTRDSVSLVAISLMKPLAFQLLAMAIFRVGGTVVLLPRFTPGAFWNCYLDPPAKTILALTPNLLAEALKHPLRARARSRGPALWLVGGDRTPPELHAEFQELAGGELVELCGMTETGPYAMNPSFGPKRVGSVGIAPIGVLLRIVDEQENDLPPGVVGQLVVRTPDTMIGYWNDTLATYEVLRDGWMRTGDLARSDLDGYVWLEGRLKEMIVRDGSNIAPAEVERVALSEPGVSAAVAIGVEDPPHGQALHLFVTAPDRDWKEMEQSLSVRLRSQLRPVAVPQKIHCLPELPRNIAGKVDRARLRELV